MKKVKGIKKIVCVAIALVTLLAFSGVAFAYNIYQSESTFSDGTCYNRYTTKHYLTKDSGTTYYWDSFVTWGALTFSPGGYDKKFCWTPKYSSSVTLANETTCWPVSGQGSYVDCIRNSTYNNIHYLIRNPYGPDGPNMIIDDGYMCGNWVSP